MTETALRRAEPGDLAAVKRLLDDASLPTAGVDDHFGTFLVATRDGAVIGAIGLEVYGDVALLRSAVVTRDGRGRGLGSLLYDADIEQARSLGVKRVVLLTNTAEGFFARKGFRRIDQKSVTGAVTSSVEFTGACPAHAACMELCL